MCELVYGPFTYFYLAGRPEWGGVDCPLISMGRWRGIQEEGEGSWPHPPCPTHNHRPASRPRSCSSSGSFPTPSLTPTTPPRGSGYWILINHIIIIGTFLFYCSTGRYCWFYYWTALVIRLSAACVLKVTLLIIQLYFFSFWCLVSAKSSPGVLNIKYHIIMLNYCVRAFSNEILYSG